MNERIVCIKVGGKAASDGAALAALIAEMVRLAARYRFFLVHGGGAEVTRVSGLLGLTATFRDGVRMTSAPEMEVVDMVLAGKMNKAIVRQFQAAGVGAFGLSGSDGRLFSGEPIEAGSHTGRITAVDPKPLTTLMEAGYLPIVASTSMSAQGVALNINADEAAFALAAKLPADTLLFLSDIPGILDAEKRLIPHLSGDGVREAIAAGVISGGMIPKVESSLKALADGVAGIVIGQYLTDGDLERLLAGKAGSRITLEAQRKEG